MRPHFSIVHIAGPKLLIYSSTVSKVSIKYNQFHVWKTGQIAQRWGESPYHTALWSWISYCYLSDFYRLFLSQHPMVSWTWVVSYLEGLSLRNQMFSKTPVLQKYPVIFCKKSKIILVPHNPLIGKHFFLFLFLKTRSHYEQIKA